MGVEAWMYQRLGRPKLEIVGEVLSEPAAGPPVDWIRLADEPSSSKGGEVRARAPALGSVAARGGCNLWPLAHYFRLVSPTVVGEFNTVRDGKLIPLDHSLCLRHAISGVTPEQLDIIAPLGYTAGDFETRYFEYSGHMPLWIFSNWIDSGMKVYRHNSTGFIIPCQRARNDKQIEDYQEATDYLESDFSIFDYDEIEFKKTLNMIFSKIPDHGLMFVLLSLEMDSRPNWRRAERNRWRSEVASSYPNVRTLKMADFIEDKSEILNENANHYDRRVYHRLFQSIIAAADTHREMERAAQFVSGS